MATYQAEHSPLHGRAAWGPEKDDARTGRAYLQLDFDAPYDILGFATRGDFSQRHQFVTQYDVQYCAPGQSMFKSICGPRAGNADNTTVKFYDVEKGVVATAIRFVPLRWNGYPDGYACMRCEVYGIRHQS